jgi:hypothetical protein
MLVNTDPAQGKKRTALSFCGFWKNLLTLSGAGEVASGVYIRG